MANYSKTKDFKTVIDKVKESYQFKGLDENNNPIYDENVKIPPVIVQLTVKVHGTFAGIQFEDENIRVQSKSQTLRLITPTETKISNENAGFGVFVSNNLDIIKEFKQIINDNFDCKNIQICGEFAGKGIQNKVGVSELEKFYYIFGIKVLNEESNYWLDMESVYRTIPKDFFKRLNDNRIFLSTQIFSTEYPINFDALDIVKEIFNKLVDDIEKECPVAKYIAKQDGVKLENTLGEGIVGVVEDNKGNILRFKVKGDKHQKSAKSNKFKINYTPPTVYIPRDAPCRHARHSRATCLAPRLRTSNRDW
jgi:hypothetical protein